MDDEYSGKNAYTQEIIHYTGCFSTSRYCRMLK